MKRRLPACKGQMAGWPLAAWICVLLLIAGGCEPSARKNVSLPKTVAKSAVSRAPFRDMAQQVGVSFRYNHHAEAGHRAILESLGGGVAIWDYDADGLLDLGFPGGGMYGEEKSLRGMPLGLFRNRREAGYEAVAGPAHVDTPRHFSHGVAVGDYNRDGFPDLLVTGYGGLQLWHNLGDGTLSEVQHDANLTDQLWSTSAAWGDVNGDGHLDLYVVHYVDWSLDNHPACHADLDPGEREICSPKEFQPLPDTLYLNEGDGTFRDASAEAGLRTDGKGLGVVMADLDVDGDLDIYVANDTTDNFLYLNNGGGTFVEVGRPHGAAASAEGRMDGSMGVDLCDFNHDGLPDLWVANFEGEDFALYRNLGEGQFEHDSRRSGVSSVGRSQVAFGVQCGDFDLDRFDDVLVSNGHTSLFPSRSARSQRPIVFSFDGDFFRPLPASPGTYSTEPHIGRGLAMGDLDGDGDLDAAVSHLEEQVAVIYNQQAFKSSWVAIRLIGVLNNRDAIGARVVLHTHLGDRHAQICGGRSYLSAPELAVRFGIRPLEQVQGVTIHWPNGTVQDIPAPTLNTLVTVVERGLPSDSK